MRVMPKDIVLHVVIDIVCCVDCRIYSYCYI